VIYAPADAVAGGGLFYLEPPLMPGSLVLRALPGIK
jgi:hypothetical protein